MVALANWWNSPTSPPIGEFSTPHGGSLGFDDFCRMEDINAEDESDFRLTFHTGLIYPVERSGDLVWKTTLEIS